MNELNSLTASAQPVRLTQTVQKGGCAAKIAAVELRKILAKVRFPKNNKNVLVDAHTMDDAAIYRVNTELALVQTLDFFTPIVDDPKTFGKIAAANALSDVYAMGGRPQTSMAILAFPMATLSPDIGVEILQGASDVISESGSVFVGGHSIDDDTIKFGLSVTGYVHPEKMWTNAGAKPGDDIILTKAIGTGAATAALKRSLVTEEDISDALSSMMSLNNVIDFLDEVELHLINAATDVTGFGLAGHCMQLAKASGVSLKINVDTLPLLKNFHEFIKNGALTKAHRTNREYTQSEIFSGRFNLESLPQFFDPQTSGGLLLAINKTDSKRILSKIKNFFPQSEIIGQVESKSEKSIYLY